MFWGISVLFFTVAVPVTLPPTVHKNSVFSPSLPIFVISCLFDNGHSDRCEELSSCGFDLHFPDDQWCWASFHVSDGHLYVFSGKMSVQILGPFFNQTIYLFIFAIELYHIFLILTPYWVCSLQIFSPIWLSFHFVDGFLCCAETFSLRQFVYFCFWSKKKIIAMFDIKECATYVFF